MKTLRYLLFVSTILIPVIFCSGCGNGEKYPVFGPTVDMIQGTWELDSTYMNGIYSQVPDDSSYTFIFYEDGTGISGRTNNLPGEPNIVWTATADTIVITSESTGTTMKWHYEVAWTELELTSPPIPETTPEQPYGTGRFFTIRNIYTRQD